MLYEFEPVFTRRREAKTILKAMKMILKSYGCVTVADLCSLLNATIYYVDNKLGWVTLRDAKITKNKFGMWIIRFPKPIPLVYDT